MIDYNNLSEAEQIELVELVKKGIYVIQYIDNPSEEVQLEAVKKNGMYIQFIKNPSEEVQIEAIKNNAYAIECIKDPSEEVQIEAIKKLYYYDEDDNYFVEKYIKSEKALELYNKLKRMKEIIR